MPWKAFKVKSEFCVFRIDASGSKFGKSLGCHSSRKRANSQVAALNINAKDKNVKEHSVPDKNSDNNFIQTEITPEQLELEKKVVLTTTETPDKKATDEKTIVSVPISDEVRGWKWIGQATSFQEVDRLEDAQEKTDEINETTSVFRGLIDNILLFADPEDRTTLLKSVVEGFSNRLSLLLSGFKQKNGTKDLEISPFMVYKENDQWRWFSTYSNNIRDDDIPPEIISKASHRRFVDLVDSGEVPLPALWLWHMKDLVIGQTDIVAFDDETGVAMAAGHFHEFANPVAEAIDSNSDAWGVSHGMPTPSIARNKDDRTIIEEHITKEISPLPRGKEANRWADFVALKEANMGLTEDKLNQLDEIGIGSSIIAGIQANNTKLSKEADEAGLERKEGDDPETPVETPVVETPPVETPLAEPVEETPAEVKADETLVEVEPVFTEAQTKELVKAFSSVADGILDAVEKKLDEKLLPILESKATSDQIAQEFIDQTPMMSLQDAITNKQYLESHSATGREETAVDKRTNLAKDAPVEAEPKKLIINSGQPLLDQLATDIVDGKQLEQFKQPQTA